MSQLLEIQPPRELKFHFKVKKHSICNVQLTNKTDQYVAFKVKTTSPKKYCVRPNVGVVLPKATSEFEVIMQAQKSPLTDMDCKDKFLIQNTVVPAGTMEEDITSEMFSKKDGKHVEERKLKVVILSPPHSPELSPMNGKVKQVPPVESSVLSNEFLSVSDRHSINHVHQEDVEDDIEQQIGNTKIEKPKADARLEAFRKVEPELTKATEPVIEKDMKSIPFEVVKSNSVDKLEGKPMIKGDAEYQPIEIVASNTDKMEAKPVAKRDVKVKPIETLESNPVDQLEAKPVIGRDVELQPIEVVESKSVEKSEAKSAEGIEPIMVKEADTYRLEKEVEEMKSKLLELDTKLGQAEKIISKLIEASRSSILERQRLDQRLALLKTTSVQKTVHEGFPLLFVCTVAMISIVLGYFLRR